MQNRKNDLQDIVSLEIHTKTYGISGRVSFLQLGLLYQSQNHKTYGIRNTVGKLDKEQFSLLLLGREKYQGIQIEENEIEKKVKDPNFKIENLTEKEKKEIAEYFKKKNEIQKENSELQLRNKFYDVYFPFGTTKKLKDSNPVLKDKKNFAPLFVYTDINFSFGLYIGFSFGFNFGEFLDFILGLFTIDLLNDDIK